jgi:hypothetical protein
LGLTPSALLEEKAIDPFSVPHSRETKPELSRRQFLIPRPNPSMLKSFWLPSAMTEFRLCFSLGFRFFPIQMTVLFSLEVLTFQEATKRSF